MTPFDKTVAHVSAEPTTLYGLKFCPTLEPHCSNDQDTPNWGWPIDAHEVSDCNLAVVDDVMRNLGINCMNIMEIGVHRNNDRSITNILMDSKLPDCRYLGIDIDDKRHLDNPTLNIHTLRTTSHDKVAVRQKLRQLGMNSIDILMIDGWHSVHTCVNDWGYVDLLSPHGVILLHDTNAHPGPIALFHAIDDSIFNKQLCCTDITDMGIAVCWRRIN